MLLKVLLIASFVCSIIGVVLHVKARPLPVSFWLFVVNLILATVLLFNVWNMPVG